MNLEDAYLIESLPDEFLYLFQTRYKARYAVRFKPSFYVFEKYPLIAENVFEFVISLIDKPPGIILPPDERILPTIAVIAKDFFEKHERVAIYVCDDSTEKGKLANANLTDGFGILRVPDIANTTALLKKRMAIGTLLLLFSKLPILSNMTLLRHLTS